MNDKDIRYLIESAGMAPSSDNTQPWFFLFTNDIIEVYLVKDRLLAIDVLDMYSFISIGAAIENIITAGEIIGIKINPDFSCSSNIDRNFESVKNKIIVAKLHLTPGGKITSRNRNIFHDRHTDRLKFSTKILPEALIISMSKDISGENISIHWITEKEKSKALVEIDNIFSTILLDHPPLFNGLFNTVKFSRKKLLEDGWGMDIKSLDLPFLASAALRIFGSNSMGRFISRWGIGPLVAKGLSKRLEDCGALCLITTTERSRKAFLEAGRAMESVWLNATENDLAVHPYGVITQYIHMAELEPWRFPFESIEKIKGKKNQFLSLFGARETQHPVMILRIGYRKGKKRNRLTVRFPREKIFKEIGMK